MRTQLAATLGLAMMSAAMMTATPAQAYDPCQRAIANEQQAKTAFLNWCDNHGGMPACQNRMQPGSRGAQLALAAYYAQNARRQACS